MKTQLHFSVLGSAALVLISNLSLLAAVGDPIPGTEVGLEGDPQDVIVGTARTDAAGKFEFRGLKAGNYRLVVSPSGTRTATGSSPANSPTPTAKTVPSAGTTRTTVFGQEATFQARVFRITNVRANANVRAEGLTELVGDTILLPVDPNTGRSRQVISIAADGGTITGEFKIAENESPRPQDRNLTDSVTTVVGTFVSYNNGNLTLLVSAMEGEMPKLTEFGRVTSVAVDPTDPMAAAKRLPAEEAFMNLPVGAPVKVETNSRGETAVFLIRAKTSTIAPNTAVTNADPNAWRYKQHNGEWWYYTDKNQWLIYRNGQWINFTPAGGTLGQQGAASIFDRWGNRIPTNSNQGAKGGAALPGTSSPGGDILPGRNQPAGANGGTSGIIGGGVRRALGGKP